MTNGPARPTLTIVIGGNGAGKTTWVQTHRSILPERFFNADSIADGLGGADSPMAQTNARRIVDEQIAGCLERNESFGFESTYSGNSRPMIVTQAKSAGYLTKAIFVGTDHPNINVERVAQRVQEGGHHIPEAEIRRRWSTAAENLVKTWPVLDEIDIVDNSGAKAIVLAKKVDGQIFSTKEPAVWVKNLLANATKQFGTGRHQQTKQPNSPRERVLVLADGTQTPEDGPIAGNIADHFERHPTKNPALLMGSGTNVIFGLSTETGTVTPLYTIRAGRERDFAVWMQQHEQLWGRPFGDAPGSDGGVSGVVDNYREDSLTIEKGIDLER